MKVCLNYLLNEAKGGSIFGWIAILHDNDYYYDVVNIIMTFHFENKFCKGYVYCNKSVNGDPLIVHSQPLYVTGQQSH